MESFGRFLPCLILLVFSLCPASGQSTGNQQSPPSLDRIIRQVRETSGNLSRAVVDIQLNEETADGGGRMFWKKGRFVRTTNYHLGVKGDLYVYETVSNERTTAFTFDLINPEGKSFTHALRLPYESASERSYGLSDYFLFDFSVTKRKNVKYPGYPLALNLFPKQLKTFGDRYQRSYVTVEGKRYLRLKRRAVLRRTFYFTEKLFLDPDTWTVERVVLQQSQVKRIMHVTSYQEVKGVRVPGTVRVTTPWNPAKLPFTIQYRFKGKDLKEGDVREPSWLYDPALPVVTDTGTRELHRKIKSGNESGLYGELMMAAMRYHYGLQTAHFHEDAFHTSIREARKKHPDSALLKSFKDSMVTGVKSNETSSSSGGRSGDGGNSGREDGSEKRRMYITAFPDIRYQPARPFMNYAAAFRSMMSDRFRKGKKYLKPVRDRFPYNRAAERLTALDDMKTTRKPGAFRALLNLWFVDKPLRNRMGLVRVLVRIIMNNSKFLAPVKDLHRSFEPPLLTLVLARYFTRQEDFVRANGLYLKLLENTEDRLIVRNHVLSYLRKAGLKARPLIERIDFRIPFVWLRVRLAVEAFKNGRDQKGLRLVRRVRDQLGEGWYRKQGNHRSNDDSEQHFTAFLEMSRQLNRLGERSLLLELTLRFTRRFGLRWTKPRFIETMVEIFEDSTGARFTLATIFVGMGRKEDVISKFFPVDKYPDRLLEKLENESTKYMYHMALARAITSGFIQKKKTIRSSIPLLKRGIRNHPRHLMTPYLRNALGDAYFITGDHQRAQQTYRSMLNELIDTRNPAFYRSLVGRLSWSEVRSAIQDGPPSFSTRLPVVVKLAYAYRKGDGPSERALKELLPIVRFSGNVPPVILAFLILDRKPLAVRYLMNRFQYLRNKKRLKQVVGTLVKLFTSDERFAEAALVLNVATRTKKLENKKITEKYDRVKQRVDRDRLIRELKQQNLPEPSKRTRRLVQRKIKKLEKGTGQSMKQQMKHVTRILNMEGNPVPILMQFRNHSSPQVRHLVRRMLETYRMRQIYDEMFHTEARKEMGTPVVRPGSDQQGRGQR